MDGKIWHYDPVSGVLQGEGQAREDPREPGRWLIPRNATDRRPPNLKAGEVAVWRGKRWEAVAEAELPPADAPAEETPGEKHPWLARIEQLEARVGELEAVLAAGRGGWGVGALGEA